MLKRLWGKEEGAKSWKRIRAEETVSFFILLKALKSSTFIMWYCQALKTERGIERQWRVCLWRRRQMYSSPSSHDLAYQNRDRPEHETTRFYSLCWFSFPRFLSSYLSVWLSCWFQMQHRPTLLCWRDYWREFRSLWYPESLTEACLIIKTCFSNLQWAVVCVHLKIRFADCR